MLHEILLSLSGHPSPLLTQLNGNTNDPVILSPPEKALLASIAHLSDLHCKVLAHAKTIPKSNTSSICQAVAASIRSNQLVRFQQKIIEVERDILRKDAGSVGAYNIVPLTAVVGEFSEWTRKMEWLWEVIAFIEGDGCTGAKLIDRLCEETQTGYSDIQEAAIQLVQVAEMAWLKQSAAWILYGRLPSFGADDFFIHQTGTDPEEYGIRKHLLPAFVSRSTAASILFIGRSLNHIRARGVDSGTSLGLLPTQSRLLSTLPSPITSSNLTRVVSDIRHSLSQSALQQILPLSRIMEILSLLYDFFLLGRGEFAIALITEADEKIRSRWQRADNKSYEKRERMRDIVVKDGEVSAVLARTWTAMFALQTANSDDDDQLELARALMRLVINKSPASVTPGRPSSSSGHGLAMTPFNSLLLSVPTTLTMQVQSPLDLFLAPFDIDAYSTINAYLLSVRRAHLRLTDLWKIASLRRHHPAPPAPHLNGGTVVGRAIQKQLRNRSTARAQALRSVWATSSAALFLLGEVETYFHGQIVKETWDGLQEWLRGSSSTSRPSTASSIEENEDVWTAAAIPPQAKPATKSSPPSHDPQTLADAHRRYLRSLTTNLLLNEPTFTASLYQLLQQIDHLVALVGRIHTIWQALDLEDDAGVVDAFSDYRREEKDVQQQLNASAGHVKDAIERLIDCLRDVNQNVGADVADDADIETDVDVGAEALAAGVYAQALSDAERYEPRKVGKLDRLLMKLDFGSWFVREAKMDGDGDGEYYSADE